MYDSSDASKTKEEAKQSNNSIQKDHFRGASQLLNTQNEEENVKKVSGSLFKFVRLTSNIIENADFENILQTNILREIYAISLHIRDIISSNKDISEVIENIGGFIQLYNII